MNRTELDTTLKWTEAEGWNPGRHDADIFWATDPSGFLVAEVNGQVVGTGAVVRYEPNTFFLGLFMVRPDFRGQGFGRQSFDYWSKYVQGRLATAGDRSPVVAMDGVVAMQPFYKSKGFELSHQQTRFSLVVDDSIQNASKIDNASQPSPTLVKLSDLPYGLVEKFDRLHFGALRTSFLQRWIVPKEGTALALVDSDGSILGTGVIRRAHKGWRIGPLFAAEPDVAQSLLLGLCSGAGVKCGDLVYLDVPEVNEEAMKLVSLLAMKREFTCGRMYFGLKPELPWQQIYGISTFELG
jgi:GNAT superfamily N-acetyltransferase